VTINWKAPIGIAIAIVIIVAAFLLWHGCNPSPVPPQKLAVDSTVIKAYQSDTAALHHKADSSITIATSQKHRADSLQVIVNSFGIRLDSKAKQITDLIAKVNSLAPIDTTAYSAAVLDLEEQVNDGIGLVQQYKDSVGVLSTVNAALRQADSMTINTLGRETVDCNNFAFALQLDVQRLRQDSAVLATSLVKSKKTTKISILIAAILAGIVILKK
jgi:hypothetical protein